MFDNRWDNWAGDFAESFPASILHPAVRIHVPEILSYFGQETRKLDKGFPDEVSPGTFLRVMSDSMPRLKIGDGARPHVAEVIAVFLEYLAESGRVGEGLDWADQVRTIATAPKSKSARGSGGAKGTTIRKSEKVSPLGRNDPCPCGSGKKFKKCCMEPGVA